MYYIYIIKSLKNNKRYTGFTNKDPLFRLEEHNSGKNSFTRNNSPYVLLYTEEFSSKSQAERRERFLKTGQGRIFLSKIIPP